MHVLATHFCKLSTFGNDSQNCVWLPLKVVVVVASSKFLADQTNTVLDLVTYKQQWRRPSEHRYKAYHHRAKSVPTRTTDRTMPSAEPHLPVQAEKVLPYSIHPHLLAYCTRTDLFAVVNDEEVVDVYRLRGQKAFSVKRKSPTSVVVGLKWIRNGMCLFISTIKDCC